MSDECGHLSTAIGQIIVIDTTAPILMAPSDLTLTCGDFENSSPALKIKEWYDSATASDICGGLIAITNSFELTDLDLCAAADYEVEVYFEAQDQCGNATLDTAKIIIEVDDVLPVITAPVDITIDCSSLGTADASFIICLLYTSPSPRDRQKSRMPSSA